MKRFSRRDFLKLGGAALLAMSLPSFEFALADTARPAPLIWRGSTRHRYLALTYDDCYLLRRIHDLENLLEAFPEFKVTLFPVGVAILNLESQDKGIWNRFYQNGHEIGYHSWEHTNFGDMSAQEALDDYARWFQALSSVLGFTPKVHFGRATYGSLAASFRRVCREHGLVNTMWSAGWGGDPNNGLHAAHHSKNGDIVLLHIRTEDLETSRQAYPWLRENGWVSVTLSKLYDDALREQYDEEGCEADEGDSLTRTCLE